MDGDDAMHPPLILFDYRTREFEPARRHLILLKSPL
jgi:hypothetical protein